MAENQGISNAFENGPYSRGKDCCRVPASLGFPARQTATSRDCQLLTFLFCGLPFAKPVGCNRLNLFFCYPSTGAFCCDVKLIKLIFFFFFFSFRKTNTRCLYVSVFALSSFRYVFKCDIASVFLNF